MTLLVGFTERYAGSRAFYSRPGAALHSRHPDWQWRMAARPVPLGTCLSPALFLEALESSHAPYRENWIIA